MFQDRLSPGIYFQVTSISSNIHVFCFVLTNDSKLLPQVSVICHNTHVTIIMVNATLPPKARPRPWPRHHLQFYLISACEAVAL